jgi:chromosome segregation ATPase
VFVWEQECKAQNERILEMEKSCDDYERKLKEHKSAEQRLQCMLEKVKDNNYDLRENLNTLSEVKSINGKTVDDKMAKFLPKKD